MPPRNEPPSRIRDDSQPELRDVLAAVERVDDRCARVEKYITGGSEPTEGLLIQVDRLKEERQRQRERNAVWYVAIVGALVSGVGSAAWLVVQAIQLKQVMR